MSIRARSLGLLVLLLAATAALPLAVEAAAAPAPTTGSVAPGLDCGDLLAANTEISTIDPVAPSRIDVLANDCDGKATANRPVTISKVGQGALGSVTTDGFTVVYDPKGCSTGSDSFSYTITDGLTSKSALAVVSIRKPGAAPVTDLPQAGFVANSTIGSTVPLKVSWCGAAATGSSVKSYLFEQSTNGGSTFPTVLSPATTATSSTRGATPGTSYAWRIATTDTLNRTGAFAASLTSRVMTIQDNNAAVKYSSGWSSASSSKYSGGRERYTSRAGATATVTVSNVRAVAIVTSRGPGRGSFHVYVDGVRVTPSAISQRTATAVWRRVVFVRGLTSGAGVNHTVQFRAVGNGRVDLDTFLTLSGKQDQAVTFSTTAPTDASYRGSDYAVAASASSGLPVTLSIPSTSWTACSLTAGVVRFHGSGTCRINATQPGDATWNARTSAQIIAVAKRPVTVTGITANDRPYNGGSAATLDTGGALLDAGDILAGDALTLVTTGATGTFTPDGNVGAGKTVTVSGLTLSGTGAAHYAIEPVTATADIGPKALSVNFVSPDRAFDGTTDATITSCSLVGVVAGDAVTCDKTGATAAFDDAAVGTAKTVTASGFALAGADAANYQIGTVNSAAADITKGTQSITFSLSGVSATYGDDPVAISASASSGLVVGFAAQTTAVCTVAGGDVTIVGSGTCTIRASQPGNATWLAAPNVDRSFAVAKRPVHVTGITAVDKTYNGSAAATLNTAAADLDPADVVAGDTVSVVTTGATGTFTPDANAGSGKSVTVSGLSLSGADAAKYAIQPVTTTADINPKALTVSFVSPDRPYNGTTAAAISSCSLAGVVSGDVVTCDRSGATADFDDAAVGTGKTVTGSGFALAGADAANYDIGTVNPTTADITKGTQAITFDLSGVTATYGDDPVGIDASASSGLVVAFASQTGAVCTVAAGDVTIVASGTCTIRASQAGNATWLAAPNVDRSFTVAKRAITVTAVTDSKLADGDTSSSGLPTVTQGSLATGDVGTFIQVFDTPAVGTDKTLTPSGTIAHGATNVTSSYAITFEADTTGVILASGASLATSTVVTSPGALQNNGVATALVTVQLKDALGVNLTVSGGMVAILASHGSVGAVTDHANGTYTATYTSDLFSGFVTVSATLNGDPIVDEAQINQH